MTNERTALTAERRHRSVSVAPPGWNTLPDLRDSRENIFTNDFGVGVSPTSDPIRDRLTERAVRHERELWAGLRGGYVDRHDSDGRADRCFVADGEGAGAEAVIRDASGRVIAPAQTPIVDRPFGPWTQNAQVSA